MQTTERTYSIREIFDTLQGEGARTGSRSVFIRFAGCNLWNGKAEDRIKGRGACAAWCDTDFAHGTKMTASDIVRSVEELWKNDKAAPWRWVVLTGGEPALQIDQALLDALYADRICVAVETNGSVANTALNRVDWLCVSPKIDASGVFNPLAVRGGHELKVVLPGAKDGVGWTDDMLDELRRSYSAENYYVQPQDPSVVGNFTIAAAQREENIRRCIDFVKAHPEWRLSLQTHKILNLP